MKITIAGDLGSGKSTVRNILAKELSYDKFSIGDFMGDMAMKRNITLLELSKLAETDKSIDIELDKTQVEFGKSHDEFVLDARLGWHFIPDSFKVYLKVDPDEAAKRIYNDKREDETENTSKEATKQNIITRKQSEKKRYKEYYGLNYDAPENFDIIIDTTNISPQEVANKIIEASKKTA